MGITQFVQISTGMISNFVEASFALVAELFARKEGRHACGQIVKIVVVMFPNVGPEYMRAFKRSLETTLSWYPGRAVWNFFTSAILCEPGGTSVQFHPIRGAPGQSFFA